MMTIAEGADRENNDDDAVVRPEAVEGIRHRMGEER